MPLGTEVVIQARDSKVGSLRDSDIGRETQNIDPVTAGAGGARSVRLWFKLPELLHGRTDSKTAGIKRLQVVSVAGRVLQNSKPHVSGGNFLVDGGGIGIAEALVVGKEICLPSQNLF